MNSMNSMNNELRKKTVRDMKSWVLENITEDLTVPRVSVRSGYSTWHFQRLFKEHTGTSLASFIREKKIIECVKKIRSKKYDIIDIVVEYNFGSQQQFTRAFKKITKCTPGRCKRNSKLIEPQPKKEHSDWVCSDCEIYNELSEK